MKSKWLKIKNDWQRSFNGGQRYCKIIKQKNGTWTYIHGRSVDPEFYNFPWFGTTKVIFKEVGLDFINSVKKVSGEIHLVPKGHHFFHFILKSDPEGKMYQANKSEVNTEENTITLRQQNINVNFSDIYLCDFGYVNDGFWTGY